MQICGTCGVERPLSDFYPNYRIPGAITKSWCKPCRREHDQKPETKDKRSASYQKNKLRDPELIRRWNLRRNYGITIEQYEALLTAQGGVCAACRKPPGGSIPLHVDHDHACCPGSRKTCGRCVRGLLCGPCNAALGRLDDDPMRLVRYLEAPPARSVLGQ